MRKLLTLTSCLFCALCANAQTQTMYDAITGLSYHYVDSEKSTVCTFYSEEQPYVGHLKIPAHFTHDGRTLTVTEIGYLAGLKKDTLLTELTIPETVTHIYDAGNISACPNLKAIHVAPANPYFKDVQGRMVVSKKGDTLYAVPPALEGALNLPASIRYIKQNAICECHALTALTLTGVEAMDDWAVTNCERVKVLNLGNKLKGLDGDGIYGMTAVEQYAASHANPYLKAASGILFSKDGKTLMAYPAARTAPYTIPASVRRIHTLAFAFSKLKSITLPATLTAVGDEAFVGSELEEVVVKCDKAQFGRHVFAQCEKLKTVRYVGAPTEIPDAAFYNCAALETLELPLSLRRIGSSAFDFSGLKSIDIPRNVREIGAFAFRHLPRLEHLSLPTSQLEHIGEQAFTNCTFIDTLLLPNIRTIGKEAFQSCKNLAVLYLGNKVDSIGQDAFAYADKLRYIFLDAPAIGSRWFGTSRARCIVWGPNVRRIEPEAFDGNGHGYIALSPTPPTNLCSFKGRIDPHHVPAPSIRVPVGSGKAYTEAFKDSDLVPYESEIDPEELRKSLPFANK